MLPLLLSLLPQGPAALPNTPVAPADVQHLATVDAGLRELVRLQRLGADVVYQDLSARRIDVIATDAELARLAAAGLDAQVVTPDLAGWYAARLSQTPPLGPSAPQGVGPGAWLTPAYGQGSMGGYWTYDEVVGVLNQLHAAYPDLVSAPTSIGQSLEGREQWMVRVSDNAAVDEDEPEVRFDSLHHAREPQGMQTALYFLCWLVENHGTDPLATYLVDERELYFVPVVNPDGYVWNELQNPGGGGLWRKNRRDNGDGTFGVDLNRNYPYEWGFDDAGSSPVTSSETYRGPSPASEPEIQNMVAFLASREFATALSIHTYSNLWLSAWGYDELYPANWPEFEEIGDLATEVNGYPNGPASIVLYTANGSTLDQDLGQHGTLGWTPEIGAASDGFWPAPDRIGPLAVENLLALQRTALAAGPWMRIASTDLLDGGDGDGDFEAGEQVILDLQVRNSGLATSGAVDVTLTTDSPWAHVVSSPGALAGVGSFQSVHLVQALALAPGTPGGTVVEATLTVAWDGCESAFPVSLEVGSSTVLAAFDFEAATDEGWTLGAPNDASTGTWERGDPNGTAAQPEDDASPAGTQCWFTGQGAPGGSLGANDVDGGTTSLLSPLFDASGLSGVELGFALWYSNTTGGAPEADVFEVDLSNDGGANWLPLAVYGPAGPDVQGGWTERAVLLDGVLPFTPNMRLRFRASDLGTGSIVEAALDEVAVRVLPTGALGTSVTCPTVPNSTGQPAILAVTGSAVVADDDLTLAVVQLPPNQFGYFLCSETAQVALNPGGSQGNLCLGGVIGRFANQVASSGPAGWLSIPVDLGQLPTTPVSAVQPGETWHFQLWHRDLNPGSTSNFTETIGVTFQ